MTTYREVNSAWPDTTLTPTPAEAITGTKRLIRRAFALAREEGMVFSYGRYIKGRKFKLTSGRRATRGGRTWFVNPNERRGQGGWPEIVHSVSHWAQRWFWPKEQSHGPRHVWVERDLAAFAIANFLDGQLKRPEGKAKPAIKAVRAARVAARIKRWEATERRAVKALRKLRRQARYYGLVVNR